MISPTDLVLSKLHRPTKTRSGWSARCPSHNDRRPSLSISEGDDGRALLRCHAGCRPQAIVEALGLRPTDLMPADGSAGPRRNGRSHAARGKAPANDSGAGSTKTNKAYANPEAAIEGLVHKLGPPSAKWDYHDASGEVVGLVVRWDTPSGKTIRPVSRTDEGWVCGGMPEPRPLYRLPELAEAERVFVVEGEKCAEAARSIGLVATTSPHGSQSASKADWSPLAAKSVAILPDHDDAGGKYANDVAAILGQLDPPAKVRIVALPGLGDKEDLADWIAARAGTEPEALRQELERLADAAPVVAVSGPVQPATGDLEPDPWPSPVADEALHGLAGDIVRSIEPYSEADPMAILAQVLVAFGSAIGRRAYFRAEADRHHSNLFVCLVGNTSKGRKGTSWGHVRRLFAEVDPAWATNRVQGGLSSGEGLIWAVRDPIIKREPVREKGRLVDYQEVEADPGVDDKRLFVLESEFASVLKVAGRERNTLSAIIRQAWDTGDLRTLTKNSPAKATGAHISIVGHITRTELRQLICETDLANGLANRFLWLCVRRSKLLPEGGSPPEDPMAMLVGRLRAAVEFAEGVEVVERDEAARRIWREVYPSLSEGKLGLLGAATGRAEAQVMRLAMLYALLDHSAVIRAQHLMAGLAFWQYAEESARYIFGGSLGDPTADEIRRALSAAPEGLTRTEIREHFGRHKSSDEIGRALAVLHEHGLARSERTETDGRPAEVWLAA